MTLVVDASVAIKWFVEEDGRQQALHVLDLEERQATDLIAEVAHGIWKKTLRGEVTDSQASVICAALPRYFKLCIWPRRWSRAPSASPSHSATRSTTVFISRAPRW
jgi:predicted nucleic acid-binding protein